MTSPTLLDLPSARGDVSAARATRPWLLVAALLAVWFPALNHLRFEWTLNEQYQFGWVVPCLTVYLCFLRWGDRPLPSSPLSARLVVPVGVLGLLAFPALLLFDGANPDWRMLGWLTAPLSIVLTLLGVAYVGGTAWVRHFLPAILFFLVAVPWPMPWEGRVMKSLMGANAAMAVEVLNLAGAPATQAGNVVDLGTTHVGVNEACSGVRSLQCAIMMGVLMGELFRLSVARRIGLLGTAIVIALLWNCVRTLTLVVLALRWGAPTMEAWHDRIGLVVLVAWVSSVLFASKFFRGSACARGHSPETLGAGSAVPGANVWSRIPRSWSIAVIVWVVLASLGVEAWYRSAASEATSRFAWAIQWPARWSELREAPIPERIAVDLRYDRGTNKTWVADDGRRWSAFDLDWNGGRNGKVMARLHRPDKCLPANGMKLVGDLGEKLVVVHGIELPFRHYRFDAGGEPVDVFFGVFSSGERASGEELLKAGADFADGALTWTQRVNAVATRARDFAQRQLEFAVWGVDDPDEAVRAFGKVLGEAVQPARPESGKLKAVF